LVAVEGDVDLADAQPGEAVGVLGTRLGAVVAVDGAGAPRVEPAGRLRGARATLGLPRGFAATGAAGLRKVRGIAVFLAV
jgi:hypothetical protein